MIYSIEVSPSLKTQLEFWLNKIEEFLQTVKESKNKYILVFVFDPSEERIYDIVKNETVRKHQVKSQVFLTSSLKDHTALSVAGKIGLQIASKRGFPVWEVSKSHPYWQSKKIAVSSMSYSRSEKGIFTLAMIGTTNNSQSTVYNYCLTDLLSREAVAREALDHFYKNWLWQYLQREGSFPNTIIIYREGLSSAQVKRTISSELEALENVIGEYSLKECTNYQHYRPEVILMTVNKKVNTRYYMHAKNKEGEDIYKNPVPGSVIYCELASNDEIDFYLLPQKTEIGTASPCQYRLIYYHPEH